MAILVSACLLGRYCRWDGGTNRNEAVIRFCDGQEVIPVCPECAGGLTTPRLPSEIRDGVVVNREGASVDAAFREGAARCLAEAEGRPITLAILKARSPSCGVGQLYDGTFTGTLVPGDGVFAALLKERGIRVIPEADVEIDPADSKKGSKKPGG